MGMTTFSLLREINEYLRWRDAAGYKMSPTKFGEEIMNDKKFYWELRDGRRVLVETYLKVKAWMDADRAKIEGMAKSDSASPPRATRSSKSRAKAS